MLFCVECGREGPTVEGLCPACFRAKRPLVRPPETIDAVVCKECGRVETAGGWARVLLESAIPRILQERVPVDPRAARPAFSYSMAREDPRNYRLTVKLAARVQDVEIIESFTTRLRVKQGQCPTCTRRRSRYYEGIVQLRAEGRALTDAERGRLVRFVEEAVERRAAKGEEAFVSKVEVVRGGADVYLSTNGLARTLARDLADAFDGTVGSSPKLYGRRDGTDVYRVTYLVRIKG